MSESRLQAGAAQVDITPPAGTHLSGDIARHRPARLALDPLFAKAIVLERGGRKLCLLALDVTIVTAPYTARIREAASQATGIEPDAIMVHATQTHSAPSVGGFMLDPDFPPLPPEFEWANGALREYSDFAADRAVEAIRQANDALCPAQVGAASCIEGRLAFNRRAVTREGGILMPGPSWPGGPLGPTDIRYIEGPIDPELGVLCVRDEALSIRALIANYTCHPVHVFPKPFVSADWPGALAARLQQVHGPQCVSLVVNGACGNINPWPPFDPDYVEDHVRMGTILADRAQAAIEAIRFTDDAALDWRIAQVPIPLREIPADELEHAQRVIAERPQPTWADEAHSGVDYEWMVAASIYSVHLMRQRLQVARAATPVVRPSLGEPPRPPASEGEPPKPPASEGEPPKPPASEGEPPKPLFDYEVQVLRIGDMAFVGLPGEPFVECGLRIKLASPTYPTYIAHCTTTYVGYIPIREAFNRGGHEVNTRYWAKLAPEAIDLIVEGATGVLRDVFSRS